MIPKLYDLKRMLNDYKKTDNVDVIEFENNIITYIGLMDTYCERYDATLEQSIYTLDDIIANQMFELDCHPNKSKMDTGDLMEMMTAAADNLQAIDFHYRSLGFEMTPVPESNFLI